RFRILRAIPEFVKGTLRAPHALDVQTPPLDLRFPLLFPFSALHSMCPPPHRDSDATSISRRNRVLVPRVSMTRDANSRISREHPLEALVRVRCAVGHDDHASMQ